MAKIDPSFWVSLFSLACVVIFGVITATHNGHGDIKAEIDEAKKEAARDSKIETMLMSIQENTTEIKNDQKSLREDVNQLTSKVTLLDAKVMRAHERIDILEGKRGVTADDKLESAI